MSLEHLETAVLREFKPPLNLNKVEQPFTDADLRAVPERVSRGMDALDAVLCGETNPLRTGRQKRDGGAARPRRSVSVKAASQPQSSAVLPLWSAVESWLVSSPQCSPLSSNRA